MTGQFRGQLPGCSGFIEGFFSGALEFEGGLGEMAKGIEHPDIRSRAFREFGFKRGRVEIGQKSVHADDGDAEAGLVEKLGVRLLEYGGGEVEASPHFIKPILLPEPILKAAGVPAGEIGCIEVMSLFAKGADDGAIGGAVAEHEIEAFAGVGGETGDFAMSANAAECGGGGGPSGGTVWWFRGLHETGALFGFRI